MQKLIFELQMRTEGKIFFLPVQFVSLLCACPMRKISLATSEKREWKSGLKKWKLIFLLRCFSLTKNSVSDRRKMLMEIRLYDDFRYRYKCLVDRLRSQGYIALKLEKSFKKFYGRYQDLIEKYQRSVKVNLMVKDSFSG